ncbi:OmpA family protein [Pelagibaculum spongiae]|uniref:OmpA-like domain-containing protein n=1 Tax=Pelagibaculum spongiae TaxID=2080658 RepID=A0A2V1GWN4_9GAMM|nr:OmpA family protein [Pelagibaculum spongiae]PVZ65606.1 hypothetical protein DC094_17115 [Pelagibaculum spongiae]
MYRSLLLGCLALALSACNSTPAKPQKPELDTSFSMPVASAEGEIQSGLSGVQLEIWLDFQANELERALKQSGIQVSLSLESVRLLMPGQQSFSAGQNKIQSQFLPVLSSLAEVFTQYPNSSIVINGYTDSSGPANTNKQLSLKRAQAVATYLNKQGVAHNRLFVQGRGESSPLFSNTTAEGRMKNRRVELEVIPL